MTYIPTIPPRQLGEYESIVYFESPIRTHIDFIMAYEQFGEHFIMWGVLFHDCDEAIISTTMQVDGRGDSIEMMKKYGDCERSLVLHTKADLEWGRIPDGISEDTYFKYYEIIREAIRKDNI